KRLSAFVEVPVRWINPQANANSSGLGDINAGFKYAFLYDDCRVASFQLRAYAPSGDGKKGLGTEHTTLEPALRVYQQLGDRLALEGEFRDWIPIDGSDFAGNIIRYGAALSYLALDSCRFRVFPVAELVGWTFLGGKEFSPEIPTPTNVRNAS